MTIDRIEIHDLLLRCIVGINPEERVKKQDVIINLTLYADLINQAAIPIDAFGVRMQMGQPRPGPVSYTHLDVYKRQGQSGRADILLGAGVDNAEFVHINRPRQQG